jgi:glycosyltransferase involved in cell wall biosynthesis
VTSLCPVVQTVHDLAFELDPAVRRLPESRRHRRLTRMGVESSTRIIAVSSQTKSDIASVYHVDPQKIDVVYNGINPVFTPEPDPVTRAALRARYKLATPYILAVGSDISRRNYARMFAAMQIVWQAGHRVNLVLAGRNDWSKTAIFKQATAAGAIQKLVFVDAPNDLELAQLYRDALMACCASSFEGFGLSVLESMACGTPAACSDMRSLREVADDAVVYFPHDDEETMGQSIGGLIEDVEYRRQLRYRGLARAARFTWERSAELIMNVLEQAARTK